MLQLSGGQIAGSKAEIHAMHVFNDDNTEGILLMDAENALNSINRKVMFNMPSYSYIYIELFPVSC